MPIIQFSFALAILFIAKLVNGDNQISVLVIEANFPRGMSHYALHKKMVEDLARQEWVKKVVFLIPILRDQERDRNLEQEAEKPHSKLAIKHALVELKNEPGEKAGVYKPWENINSQYEPGAITGTITRPDVFLELAKREKLIKELNAEHFDVGIAEVFYYGAFPLLWLANVKHIVATSNMPSPPVFYQFMNDEYLGKIKEQSVIPKIFTDTFDKDVTNSMRAYDDLDEKFEKVYHAHYAKLAVAPPKFEELFRRAKYYFINSQPFLDFNLPNKMLQADKLKFIGGMAAINNNSHGMQQELHEEEIAAIEQANREGFEGLIIVSFGTVVETEKTPDQIFKILFDAFKRFPNYVFLWRFEKKATDGKQQAAIDEHNAKKKHIYTRPWLKQTALLANPATRLFISHCGINSLNEAALYGVPLVCIPFFGDQPYNAEAMAKRGLGAVVDIFDKHLTSKHVHDQIVKALSKRVKTKMQEAKDAMVKADPVGTFVNAIKHFTDNHSI